MIHSHRSMPLDPEIADVFYRAEYIERWGCGIQKICDACREHGVDEPVYTVQSNYVMVKFATLTSAIVRDSKVPNRHDDGLEVGIENKVLSIIKSNPNVTMTEISVQLSVTKRTVERTTKRLRENNRIERVGGKRYGHWIIHD